MKNILMNSALESWAMAIHYCDEIMAGKATLTNRKYFVSSLQNAVELFTKQHMLNSCDYRVAEFQINKSNGEPMKSYLLAQDLNAYFFEACKIPNTKTCFISIKFSKIKSGWDNIFKEFYYENPDKDKNIETALSTLQKLRNNEAHFYIDADTFLDDNEFKKLYNFMADFYDILKFYNLFPCWGEPFGEYQRFTFNRERLKGFSFQKQIKSSPFVMKLKDNIERNIYPVGGGDEAYAIAKDIVECSDIYDEIDFPDIWSYIQMLLKYHLLDIIETADEDMIDGQKMYGSPYRMYKVKL